MYDIRLQLLGCAMTVSKLMYVYAWCQLAQWDFLDCNVLGVLDCWLWLACAALLTLTPHGLWFSIHRVKGWLMGNPECLSKLSTCLWECSVLKFYLQLTGQVWSHSFYQVVWG